MKTFAGVIVVGLLALFALGGCAGLMVVSTLNTEATMKNGIKAQEDVREASYDKLWKKIKQETQITKASTEVQKELVESLVKGRSGSFIKIIQESNPSAAFDRNQFVRLSNIVEGERDGFFREQKVLISKVESYNNVFNTIPAGWILNFSGRTQYPNPVIISSDIAKDVRETGKENNVDLDL